MSSNLIIPASQRPTFLESNLKAFFARYPHERDRLEPTLIKMYSKPFPLIDIPLPAAPSKPPIRILLMQGIVNPQFIAKLLNDPTVQKENFKLFIFENDPEFLAFCFRETDLTQLINYRKTEWFLMHSVESVKSALFSALKPEDVTSMMLNVQSLDIAVPRSKELSEYYEKIPFIYDETAKHVLHNHGNLDDSILGIEVTVTNKDRLLSNPGIADLEGFYKGRPALIIGAGPTLDQHIDEIKAHNDKYIVIAVDAALKPLRAKGIRVDYVTSIERLNAYQKPFFEDLPPQEADLVAFPVIHPDLFDLYPGTVRICYRNYSFYAYFEKAYPKGILKCGGSTSHLAVRLADYMGCNKIRMVGLDSCYEEKDGLFRSHCSGTGHKEWGEFTDLSVFAEKRRHLSPMKAPNNLGELTMTNITYYQWAKEYAEELAYLGSRVEFINCSAKGLKFEGIPYKPLAEASEGIESFTYTKPESQRVLFNRNWDNKDLLKNFKAWREAAEEGIKVCDELLTREEIPNEEFHAVLFMYNFRFVIDDLFVAFVVQCAALNYFILENQFWALGLDFLTEKKEKTAIYKKKFELFKLTLDKLIPIFEGEQINGSTN